MSRMCVRPGPVGGRLLAPPSKSYTHRALAAAHLADRATTIRRPLVSDDTLRTARAVGVLGSRLRLRRGTWTITPAEERRPRRVRTVDCGESGTTLRFASALAALQSSPYRFVGSGRLPRRPMQPLLGALGELGALVESPGGAASLPLRLRGPIHGGVARLDPSRSSQFTSALLLALPVASPSSRIALSGQAVSEPYVEATLAVLADRGVRVRRELRGFFLPGGQTYHGGVTTIPGDASSAAYLWAAAALAGGSVDVEGIPARWPQADLAVLDLLESYGASVRRTSHRVRVAAGLRRPFAFDLDDAPDLYPLAGVLAAAAAGRSVLTGAAHAAGKESDRRRETARLVRAMGGRARLSERRLVIEGTALPRPLRRFVSHDHRLVMSAAVGALASDRPSEIGEAASVGKSFPGFFGALEALGGRIGPA